MGGKNSRQEMILKPNENVIKSSSRRTTLSADRQTLKNLREAAYYEGKTPTAIVREFANRKISKLPLELREKKGLVPVDVKGVIKVE